MAEAPATLAVETAPPAAETSAPIGTMADLDARMAAIAANPPTDDATSGQEDAASAPPTHSTEPAEPVQGDVPEDEPESSTEQPKPGGRFARLREQLTAAEERATHAEREREQISQAQHQALRQFVELVLPDPVFETLRLRAEGGDWEAKQQLDTARQWRQMVGPVWETAQRAVAKQMDTTLDNLRASHGWERDTLDKLRAAPPPERLSLLYDLAHKAATDASKERIAALEAEVATLKTNRAANGSQPAAGGGRATSTNGTIAGWLGSDGLPTEEAIQRATRGDFVHLANS